MKMLLAVLRKWRPPHLKSRTRLALLLVLLAAPLRAEAAGLFGDVYPRGAPDGIVSLGDLLLIRAFALGVTVPTEAELNAANVFPLSLCITCLPNEVRFPDFATRFIGGNDTNANDPGDITIADVLVIEKVILGQIILGSGLALNTVGAINPSSGDTFGGTVVSISGNGFAVEPGQKLRISFVFHNDGGPADRIECVIPQGVSPGTVDCGLPFSVISITNNTIQVTTPDASGLIEAGAFEISAAIQVAVLDADDIVIQATTDALTAGNSFTFARGALQIIAIGGEDQAGFPLIELGVPLETFVYDFVLQSPATSITPDPLTAPYVTFVVDIVDHCPALLNDSDFEMILPINELGRTQIRVTPLADCPSHQVRVTATVTNLFSFPIIPVTQTTFVIPVAESDQGVLQVVSGAGQICPYNTTCSLDLTADTPVPEPMVVNIIDRFGQPFIGTINVNFADQPFGFGGRTGNLTDPVMAQGTSTACTGTDINKDCSAVTNVRVNFTTGGSTDPALNSAEYVVLATAIGNPSPGTFTNATPIIPAGGVTFRIRAERPVGTTIEYADPALADREADLVNDMGPFAMGVKVRDQWGRLATSQVNVPNCVTYTAQMPGFTSPPTISMTGGSTVNCPGDQQVPPNKLSVEAPAGTVTESLEFVSGSQGGIVTVRAAITSRPSARVDFRFALGLSNRPPPPVNLSRVTVSHQIQNSLPAAPDGTTVGSFLVRGALGAVRKSGDDTAPFGSGTPPTFTRYSVSVTDGGAITGCGNVSNGITGGVGLDGTGDVDQGRFEVVLTPPPTTGQLAISVWDNLNCSGEQSVPKLIGYTSRFDTGYVSNRSRSQLDKLSLDFSTPTPTVLNIDTDQTYGLQALRVTGIRPQGIMFFSSDPDRLGPDGEPLMDRAIVVNVTTGDLSVLRVSEEIVVQGNDLNLVGGVTTNVVESVNSDFLVERNHHCNRELDFENDFFPDVSDDCSVSAGDILIVRPGTPLETRRTVTAVLGVPGNSRRLILNGDLNPIQVSEPGVQFRVISRYREIDADNDYFTTSSGAEPGVTRTPVPYPDRDETKTFEQDPGRLSGGAQWKVSPRYVAGYFPEGGIDAVDMPSTGLVGVLGRFFVSDPVYNALYAFNVERDDDGQISFVRPDTKVETSGVPQPKGVIPLLSLRTPEFNAVLSFAGPTHLTVDLQDTNGDDILDSSDEAYLYVVVESDPSSTTHGGLSVFALTPDPASGEDPGNEWFDDENIRFPFQGIEGCGPDTPCYQHTTAICQDPGPGEREWVMCEVDTDFDPYTNSYASTRTNVCFDVDGDGIPDAFLPTNPNSTCGATSGVDRVSVPVPDPARDTGMTMILARQTNLPGDFLSDQFTLAFAEVGAVYRNSRTPLRFWQPFRFEMPQVPKGLRERVRSDVGFLTVRTTSDDTIPDALNDRPQLVYPVDVRPDRQRSGDDLLSSRLGYTIAFDAPGGGTGAGQAYGFTASDPNPQVLRQCVMDPNPRVTDTPGPDQRDRDDIVTVPIDKQIAVTGLPGNGLFGTDNVKGTADDLVQPQDILLFKTGPSSRIYRYTIVSVDTAVRFTVKADQCDGVPTGAITQFRVIDSMNVIDLKGVFSLADLPTGIAMHRTQTARTETLAGGIGRARAHLFGTRDDRGTSGTPTDDLDDRLTMMVTVSRGVADASPSTTETTIGMINIYDPGPSGSTADDRGCLLMTLGDSGPLAPAHDEQCDEMQGENSLNPGNPAVNLASPNTGAGGAIVIEGTDKLGFLLNTSSSQILQFRHERQAADAGHGNLPWMKVSPYPALTFNEITFETSQNFPSLFPGDAGRFWTPVTYDSSSVRQRMMFTLPLANTIAVIEQRDFGNPPSVVHVGKVVDTDNITGAQSIRIDTGTTINGPVQRLDKIEKSFYYGTAVGDSVLFVSEVGGGTGRLDLNVVDPQIDMALDQNDGIPGITGLSAGLSEGQSTADLYQVIVDEGRSRVYIVASPSSTNYRIVARSLHDGSEINLVDGIPNCSTIKQIQVVTEPQTNAQPQSFAIRDNLLLVGYNFGVQDQPRLFWLNLDNLQAADFNANCTANFQHGNAYVVPRGSGGNAYAGDIQAIEIAGDRALVAGVTGSSLKLSVIDLTQFWRWKPGSSCPSTECRPRDAALSAAGSTAPLVVESGGGGSVVQLQVHGGVAFMTVARASAPLKRVHVIDIAPYSAAPNGGGNVTFRSPVNVAVVNAPGGDPAASVVGPGWLVIPNRERDTDGNNLTLINLTTPTWNRTTPPVISGSSVHYYPAGAEDGTIRDFEFTTLPPN